MRRPKRVKAYKPSLNIRDHTAQSDEQREIVAFFNSKAWKRLRLAHLQDHPFCQRCDTYRNLQVHHVKARRDYPELALDADNLQTLCRVCHAHETYLSTLAPGATGHAVIVGNRPACLDWIKQHHVDGDLIFDLPAIAQTFGFSGPHYPNDINALLIDYQRELLRRMSQQNIQRRCFIIAGDEQQAVAMAKETKARVLRLTM